jgi:hypothetical protein
VALVPSSSRGSGSGGGTVTSVTAADTSIVVAGTADAPTIATGTLDVIAADHPPVGAVAMNAQKITGLANGSAATDAAAFGQIKAGTVTSVTAGDTSIVVGGTAAAPTIETATLDVIAADHPPAAAVAMNAKKITGLANGSVSTDALALGQVLAANVIPVADLVAGLAGQLLGGTGPGYAYPPGFEIAYDQITANVNVASTTEGSPTAIIAGTAHTYENVPYLFEFCTPNLVAPSSGGDAVIVLLLEDGTSLGRICFADNPIVGGQEQWPATGKLRFTPTAGSHTFSISAWATATTGTPAVSAGVGGATHLVPAYLRATKC